MKVKAMSLKWLREYLSCRLDISGKETKEELLHVCKLIGLSTVEVSQETVNRVNKRIKNKIDIL